MKNINNSLKTLWIWAFTAVFDCSVIDVWFITEQVFTQATFAFILLCIIRIYYVIYTAFNYTYDYRYPVFYCIYFTVETLLLVITLTVFMDV